MFDLLTITLLSLSKILKAREAFSAWTWMSALSISSLQTDASLSCRHTLGLCVHQN